MTDGGLLRELDGAVDVVVSNPPYVPDGAGRAAARWPTTTRRSRCGAGPTGWTSSAGCWSPPRGCCARAAGSASSTPTSRAVALPALVRAHGGWTDVEDHPDLAGRPRFTTARRRLTWSCGRLSLVADVYDCSDPDARAAGLDAAAAAPRRGELVLLPTDTVYGVAADAFTPDGGDRAARRQEPRPGDAGAGADRRGVDARRAGGRACRRSATTLAQAFWPAG